MSAPQPRPAGRLLLTGVPGWLTDALLDDLARDPLAGLTGVRCLVQPGVSCSAPPETRQRLNLEIVAADVRDGEAIRCAVHNVDTVLHAAGVVHVRRTRDWYDINTRGTQTLVHAAAEAGAERFVFISSNAAAGRARCFERALTEADPPHPLSYYGRSKWLGEQALAALGARMQTVVLRPCMFYGPPVPQRHVEIYRRILHGRMPLVGGGRFARSLTYIENLVQACRLAMNHPAAAGQTYYISDRPIYTTRQIVEAMAEALQTQASFVPLPCLAGRMAYAVDRALAALGIYWQTAHLLGESHWHVGVSCEKACRELGYRPTVTLAEGMRQSLAWCVSRGLLI